MKVLVCGGRDYSDAERVHYELSKLHGMSLLIQGGAPGADRLAKQWAIKNHVHYCEVPALWDSFGRAAGPRRNDAMLLLVPDLVVAFPGGRGTADMVERARKAGISYSRILPLPTPPTSEGEK